MASVHRFATGRNQKILSSPEQPSIYAAVEEPSIHAAAQAVAAETCTAKRKMAYVLRGKSSGDGKEKEVSLGLLDI